jgi:hypothetical protein
MQKLVQQTGEIEMLTRKANRETAVSDAAAQDQGISLVLLQMFQGNRGNMSRPALVARLLSSTEVKQCDHLFSRAFDFDVLSESSQSNIVEVMTSIAIGVAPTFKRFALPNIAVGSSSEESCVQFTQNPVVLAIKSALEPLGTKDQKHSCIMCHLYDP